jgi:hypothetical protein
MAHTYSRYQLQVWLPETFCRPILWRFFSRNCGYCKVWRWAILAYAPYESVTNQSDFLTMIVQTHGAQPETNSSDGTSPHQIDVSTYPIDDRHQKKFHQGTLTAYIHNSSELANQVFELRTQSRNVYSTF